MQNVNTYVDDSDLMRNLFGIGPSSDTRPASAPIFSQLWDAPSTGFVANYLPHSNAAPSSSSSNFDYSKTALAATSSSHAIRKPIRPATAEPISSSLSGANSTFSYGSTYSPPSSSANDLSLIWNSGYNYASSAAQSNTPTFDIPAWSAPVSPPAFEFPYQAQRTRSGSDTPASELSLSAPVTPPDFDFTGFDAFSMTHMEAQQQQQGQGIFNPALAQSLEEPMDNEFLQYLMSSLQDFSTKRSPFDFSTSSSAFLPSMSGSPSSTPPHSLPSTSAPSPAPLAPSIAPSRRSPKASSRRPSPSGSRSSSPGDKSCSHCHTTTTPLWRRNPKTLKPLCNACGLYLQQRDKLRPQQLIDADAAGDDSEEDAPPADHTGPRCSHCDTHKTVVWRRSKEGKLLCNACGVYQRLKGRERPLAYRQKKIKPRPRNVDRST